MRKHVFVFGIVAIFYGFSASGQMQTIGFWRNSNCPSSAPVVTELGENSGSTSPLKVVLGTAVPVGSFLIAQVAYRSINERNISDSKGNVWNLAVRGTSSTQASSIYYTKTTVALVAGDEIILSHAFSNAGLGLSVLMATVVSKLDQTGSNVTSDVPTVTTTGAVKCSKELLVGVTSYGSATSTFTATGGYTLNYGWQGGGSGGTSGGHGFLSGTSLSGTQTYAPTASTGSGTYISVIATFY